jgi:hypothetical protein
MIMPHIKISIRKNFHHYALALVIFLFSNAFHTHVCATETVSSSPFHDKMLALPGVYVDLKNQFQAFNRNSQKAPSVPKEYDEEYFWYARLGTITFDKSASFYIDTVTANPDNSSFTFLVDRKTEKRLYTFESSPSKYDKWYFASNGNIYVYRKYPGLCAPMYTSKFSFVNNKIEEIPQPFYSFNYATIATQATPLYDLPNGVKIVATAPAGSSITVIAVEYGAPVAETSVLVRTALGLTGWRKRRGNAAGQLEVELCN